MQIKSLISFSFSFSGPYRIISFSRLVAVLGERMFGTANCPGGQRMLGFDVVGFSSAGIPGKLSTILIGGNGLLVVV